MPKSHILKFFKHKAQLVVVFTMMILVVSAPVASVSAATATTNNKTGLTSGCPTTTEGSDGCYSQCASGSTNSACVDCSKDGCSDSAATPNATCNKTNGCDLVDKYINPLINTLTVLFGLIAAASIIMGGIQFTTSEGDPQKAAAAKSRISKTILAIFTYAFLYAFLQFIVPGGIFNS